MDSALPLSLIEYFGPNVDVIDLLSLYKEDIDGIFYYDQSKSPPVRKFVYRAAKRYLELFIDFTQHKYNMVFTTIDNCLKVTYAHFQEYCESVRLKSVLIHIKGFTFFEVSIKIKEINKSYLSNWHLCFASSSDHFKISF